MATATDMKPQTIARAWPAVAAAPPVPSASALAFLNHLRFVAMECRSKARTNLFEACALLHATRTASRDAHAEALMRCLGEALGRPARLHTPGTSETTFDERWLIQLETACRHNDRDSFRFLVGSRVAPQNRRLVAFLVGRIAGHFG